MGISKSNYLMIQSKKRWWQWCYHFVLWEAQLTMVVCCWLNEAHNYNAKNFGYLALAICKVNQINTFHWIWLMI